MTTFFFTLECLWWFNSMHLVFIMIYCLWLLLICRKWNKQLQQRYQQNTHWIRTFYAFKSHIKRYCQSRRSAKQKIKSKEEFGISAAILKHNKIDWMRWCCKWNKSEKEKKNRQNERVNERIDFKGKLYYRSKKNLCSWNGNSNAFEWFLYAIAVTPIKPTVFECRVVSTNVANRK